MIAKGTHDFSSCAPAFDVGLPITFNQNRDGNMPEILRQRQNRKMAYGRVIKPTQITGFAHR
jgi:hypothetical protein